MLPRGGKGEGKREQGPKEPCEEESISETQTSMCCTKSQILEMKDHKANKKITALWVQMWQ